MKFEILKFIIALFGILAVYQDLSSRRVSNSLVLISFFTILLSSFIVNDWQTFVQGLGGFSTVLGGGLILWVLRVLGGGDVKVMSIMALSLSWDRSLEFVFYSLFWGGALGVLALILDKSFLQEIRILNFNPTMTIRSTRVKGHKIPFTVGILLGMASSWVLMSKGLVLI